MSDTRTKVILTEDKVQRFDPLSRWKHGSVPVGTVREELTVLSCSEGKQEKTAFQAARSVSKPTSHTCTVAHFCQQGHTS